MTVVFCVVFSKWQVAVNDDWHKTAPRFLTGLAIWEYISVATLTACQTFFRNEAYIRQCPLPLTIYTLRSVFGATIHFGIALSVSLLTIITLNHDEWFNPFKVIWIVLPSLVLLVAFCWSLSVIAAFLNVLFQDTQQLAEVFFRIFFFLTPIIYPAQMLYDRGLGFIADYSPVAIFLELIRTPLLTGTPPSFLLLSKAMFVVVLFAGIAVTMISRLEKKLVFHL
jgi:ABC-type polysaccharide/polyol phosphate export permease